MARPDEGLAFMLRYENVAWYEDGKVRILDRRIYPAKVVYGSARATKRSPEPLPTWSLRAEDLIQRQLWVWP